MKITKLRNLSGKDYKKIINRSAGNYRAVMSVAKKIMEDVKQNSDKAVIKYSKKFNGVSANYSIQVSEKEIKEAYKQVDKKIIKALQQIIKNITAVQKNQLKSKKDTVVTTEKGISVWREWRPIEKVGIYIPGGKAVYPSSVLMTAIPAQIAGCKEIIMCSPAGKKGKIPAPTLVAADMIGLKNIYKVGGAEAIAAMVYGTQTIPSVYKIFGAGNTYVTAAKILALQTVSIDMPAGPSEVLIITDETANPKFIAADLLADGEHGEDSACVLLTTSEKIAGETIKEITKQLESLPTRERVKKSFEKYGLIAVVNSLNEAIEFSNKYAPEHLEIMTKDAESLVKKIINAGSVFLGDWTAKSSGDYATGANHVLPTGGTAKMYPPLGVEAFGKWMQVQKCTKEGLLKIIETIETIAEIEGLPAHKNSVSERFKKYG
ncbi:histidinol dehydrogenase [Candidatus Daviesbacteria bacterium RIFCSPHIGHO2_02_FULL_41_10]|uniref:Histidinol dehydrogenase n=3 Tax=Candidatus Daviesiibacteriota TaxID=1752718 RepID=A0A1F5ISI7_9BACT|nr:MAG: histidinol dehydrogenase [Candidatus Daviesbacteria bacterium RIFCSPHIGHO2_01_FULL_41_23]OGE32882.1 MAG: histidinol dehydrogenase [Candidatus Daviesbacteria bacterium RIFCSPHIGHO2_02_FULL_41_10]OGE62382.1 MAG: histidinol dehydrogenase [Candidatus Daviesbacteria bacterium RIFCSPLOWO2_01_FULL_41_32]